MTFVSPSFGRLSSGKMVLKIAEFIESDPNSDYSLVIGTDSQTKRLNGKAECDFVTAIVIHRKGCGARYFWKKEKAKIPPILRDKIYGETTRSLETARTILPAIQTAITQTKCEFEIHVDVGTIGKTRDMIKEVVGMVNGNGFTAKTKPGSWGASSVADRHT